MKLAAKQIERLVKQGEVVHTECKDASGGLPDSLWESYSSFANTDGGVILLGVKEVDRKFSIVGVPKAATLIKRFWDGVNNREKVSVNILFDRHVYSVKCRGRDVVVIEVPRADRQDRPVYIGKDMFSGTFRRNGEGDYHCPRESVKAMVRDACVETADACLLDELTIDDLCAKTIRSYRNRFKSKKPEHVWNDLPDEEFLVRIRAARRGEDGKVHPNLAGLVCFAEFGQIMDVLPDFFLDYREKLSTDTRWTDRIAAHDATWSGNIFALVDIGERSGTGLADLYGHWKKNNLPAPVITEEFDPDRVKITVYTDSDQSAQGAPKTTQGAPSIGQNRPKTAPKSAQGQSEIGPRQGDAPQNDVIIIPSELRDELASVRQVYKAIVANTKATYRGLAAQLDFSKDTIGRAIATLIRLKIIRREGNKQTGHWEVVK